MQEILDFADKSNSAFVLHCGDLNAEFYASIDNVIYYAITSSKYLDNDRKRETAYPEDLTYEYLDYDKDGNLLGTCQKRYADLPQPFSYYCEEPLSAIVAIDDDGVFSVKGMQSTWVNGTAPKNKNLQFNHDNYITDKAFQLDF